VPSTAALGSVSASVACDFFDVPRNTWYQRIRRGEIAAIHSTYAPPHRGRGRPPQMLLEEREIARLLDEEERQIERLRRDHAARRRIARRIAFRPNA
jgi:hypothetical protein